MSRLAPGSRTGAPPLPAEYLESSPATPGLDALGGLRDLKVPWKTSKRFRRRRRIAGTGLAVILFFLWSFGGALATPGNQSLSAKWADWLRGHHAGMAINYIEAFYYSHNAPAKGGHPRRLNALPVASGRSARGPTGGPTALPLPTPVPLSVLPTLPQEGVWLPVGSSSPGGPGMLEAQFRADAVYTAQITSAVWIDPHVVRVGLVPGATEPGGSWTHPPFITPAEVPTVLAAFNAGFRSQDARGGFYLDGRTAVPLVAGAASFVLHGNGHVDVGAWGSEVAMTPDVVAVLQNLVPLVDHGQLSASATTNDSAVWGSTLGAATIVARSGLGVTASGALVYVAGPALSAQTLAESLQRVGAVRAMTLDINPEWVTFNFYSHPDPTNPAQITATKLYPQMQRPASRYLGPTEESREFFTLSRP